MMAAIQLKLRRMDGSCRLCGKEPSTGNLNFEQSGHHIQIFICDKCGAAFHEAIEADKINELCGQVLSEITRAVNACAHCPLIHMN